MHRIFSALRRLIADLAAPSVPADAISSMSPRDYADLPVYHPPLGS